MSDPVRDEAERLVTAAISAVSMAARGLSAGTDGAFATGSAECCVCPVCRVIAAMREPSPDLTDRLVAGAGDLAAGVASLLRAVGNPGPDTAAEAPEESRQQASDPWHAATTDPPAEPATRTAPAQASGPAEAPRPMAKKAVKKAASQQPPLPRRHDDSVETGS